MHETKFICCYYRIGCGVDHDGVAEKRLTLADTIGAWVCSIGVAAAVVLVVVLAARG
jgi:hypothetical protein